MIWLYGVSAVLLFAVGLRLSAFFSGSETGFYRVSFLQVSIDAQAGDQIAERLCWYLRHPAWFVATTLVGNNVSNYLTTFAIGLAALAVAPEGAGTLEIAATLALSPVVFVFGELIPKTIYYRAPQQLLRQGATWFHRFFLLFLPISFPLTLLTRLVERMGKSGKRQLEFVLGRSRLVQVLSEGHREGLLSNVQNRLIDGLLEITAEPVVESMTPIQRVLGVAEESSREELVDYARRFGLSNVLIRRTESEHEWFGYVSVFEAATQDKLLPALIRELPIIEAPARKLEALITLRNADAPLGAVADGDTIVGVVSERGLVEQLFRPSQTSASAPTSV